jgi:hypothetical protein
MTADVDFMRTLETDYRQVSGLKNRSEYKIFYGQVFPVTILTLGLNPAGTPEGTSEDGTRRKDGSRASASASYFEQMENDILDCEWPENTGLRKLLLPLVGNDQARFRCEIVKSNIAFRRSGEVRDIDLAAAEEEAVPFIEKIIDRVKPRLIVLTGVGLDRFLRLYAGEGRPLSETIRDPGVKHVVFAAAAARMRSADRETVVVQVAHASQFSWTYEKYSVAAKIIRLMGCSGAQEYSTESGVQSTATSTPSELPTSVRGRQSPQAHAAPIVSISNPRLSELATRWTALGIVHEFHRVHHFASRKFSGKRESMRKFIEWCDAREIKAENAQTVERALYVARLVEDGQEFMTALKGAWDVYPIVTRSAPASDAQ